jgi:hypothetical protein
MEYDSNKNILMWRFVNDEYTSDGKFKRKQNYYNAHNGEYIEEKINNGEWIE